MSSKDIKTMINTLEKWLVTAEAIIKNETNFKVFLSDYGIEFYTDFTDLIEVGYLYMFPKVINVFQGELNKIKSLDQAKNKILDLVKQLINQGKPKGEKKKKSNEFLSKLKEKADETILIIRKELRDFEKIFKELDNIIETPEPEQKEEEIEESSVAEIVNKTNLYQRINAYFVIALYAIIDVYCLSFLQDSLSRCSKDILHESLRKISHTPSNPVESLNTGLDVQKKNNINLKEIRKKLIKKLKWEIHQESFNSFKNIRKVPAHQKTVLSLDELKERFPKQLIIAEKLFNQVLKELDNEIIPPIIKKPLLEGIEDLKIGLYLREIGNSCLRYLVLNEAILQYYLYKDRFLEETSEIMREREKS